MSGGPLEGLRVVELGGIGPVPYAGMLLSDLGADVVRVDRAPDAGSPPDPAHATLLRGRRSVAVDLTRPGGVRVVLALAERAEALLEGFRPGVAERLGVGPEPCLAANPALAYVRVTGWGQQGPAAATAGHDLNFLAVTGALFAIGPAGGPPVPPLNLVGDFGGGGMLAALGALCAVLRARRTGVGQVVDAAVVDGVASLMAMAYALRGAGLWVDERGRNLLDGGAPFYAVYACADGRHVAVAALEDRFYAALLAGLGLTRHPACAGDRHDPARWPALRHTLATAFATRPRDEWAARFPGTDACVTPVLSMAEAPRHPVGGRSFAGDPPQPAPAPRFSAGAAGPPRPAPVAGEHGRQVLAEAGFTDAEVEALLAGGAVRLPAT